MNADSNLADDIAKTRGTDKIVETHLLTSERVIARVTDGIYRQPGSALRELISNAYDADSKNVFITTDAPRFERITITDDGNGMSPEILAYLIQNIGGSAKRTHAGSELGVADTKDALYSPGKRRLIGKIGIGLFSVAQLTQTFQVYTKVKNDPFRTIASITLRTYTEDDLIDSSPNKQFDSGIVKIWSEPASDLDSHGTTIVLTDIRPQAKDTLRSADRWAALEEIETGTQPSIEAPTYHIGKVDGSAETIEHTAKLPWKKNYTPSEKFNPHSPSKSLISLS